jgi:hypothetical protein
MRVPPVVLVRIVLPPAAIASCAGIAADRGRTILIKTRKTT